MFTHAIVRRPGANLANGLTTVDLGVPDYPRALRQHDQYCAALEKCGLTLTRLEADDRHPDATFVEDTAVLIPALPGNDDLGHPSRRAAILTRPGAASRAGEVESIAKILGRFYSTLDTIQEPGTVDGGDICETERHFFIGISERTNEAGAQRLATLLAKYDCTSSMVDIRGMGSILHLKSGISYLGDKRLAVIDALAEHEEFQRFELVRVSAGEEYAANCVRVNRHVLVAAGYAQFERALGNLGYQTISLEMSEFQKLDGGLSCLSLRF